MTDDVFVIVGLGNPGPRYANNRHNVGFMVVDVLARRIGASFKTHRAGAYVAEGRLGAASGRRVILVKPMSFMNLSGGPVAQVCAFFKVPTAHLIAIHDELDIPYGTLRLKRGGGAGGHNGLRSLTQALSSPDYLRVRFGIGRPPGRQAAADFVLTDFSIAERRDLGVHIERAADAAEALLFDELAQVQNTFHAPAV